MGAHDEFDKLDLQKSILRGSRIAALIRRHVDCDSQCGIGCDSQSQARVRRGDEKFVSPSQRTFKALIAAGYEGA
jgi:hypothetical protein